MQPFFFLELRFAAAVCELSREQRQAIANRAKPMIDDLARELAEHDQQEEGRNPNMVDVHLNPARRLLDGLGPIVKAQVSSEKWSRYRDELKKRDADRKQAIIHNLVASLDRELIMSASQRQKLRDVFIDEWKDDWGWGSAVEMDTDVWLPDISEERVAPILSDAQHKAWKQLEKKAPDPWEGFEFAAELFEITRTADEAEIGKVAGFPADSQ